MSLDFEKIVSDFAWDYFNKNANKKQSKMHIKNTVGLDIKWTKCRFDHETTEFIPPPTKEKAVKKNNTLFKTTFSNRTDNRQMYTFKTERTTRSTCSVEIEDCFTKGMAMDVKITTPCSILEANAGFSREMSITNTRSQTIEEELSWSVDSEIEVKAGHRVEAKMIINEEEYSGKFSQLTLVTGRITVNYVDKSKDNRFIMGLDAGIVEIMQWAKTKGSLDKYKTLSIDPKAKVVSFSTVGTCQFRYGLQQDVIVDQMPIADMPQEVTKSQNFLNLKGKNKK